MQLELRCQCWHSLAMGDTGGDTEKYYHEVGLTRDQVTSVTNQNTASDHVTAILISHWWVVDQVAELRKAFDSFDSEKRGAIR